MTARGVPVAAAGVDPGGTVLAGVNLERFRDAVANVRVELRAASPEWARETLAACNKKNRRLSPVWSKIRAAIQRDAWQVNGETVAFDRAGRLVNGQHRLTAIAAGGVAVPLLVVYGVPPGAFATYDQGKKRNTADVLSIEGHDSTCTLASALAWQWRHESGKFEVYAGQSPANDQIAAIAAGHPEMPASVAFAHANQNRLIPPGMLAFLHYTLAGIDAPAADEFFRRVVQGLGVTDPSHEFNLRRRLDGLMGLRAQPNQVEICALCLKTWGRIRRGDAVPAQVVWKQAEPFPAVA